MLGEFKQTTQMSHRLLIDPNNLYAQAGLNRIILSKNQNDETPTMPGINDLSGEEQTKPEADFVGDLESNTYAELRPSALAKQAAFLCNAEAKGQKNGLYYKGEKLFKNLLDTDGQHEIIRFNAYRCGLLPKGEAFGIAAQAWDLEEAIRHEENRTERLESLAKALPGHLSDWAYAATGNQEAWTRLCEWQKGTEEKLQQEKKHLTFSPTDRFLLPEVKRCVQRGTQLPTQIYLLDTLRQAEELLLPVHSEPMYTHVECLTPLRPHLSGQLSGRVLIPVGVATTGTNLSGL